MKEQKKVCLTTNQISETSHKRTISRHARVKVSFTLLIWLYEKRSYIISKTKFIILPLKNTAKNYSNVLIRTSGLVFIYWYKIIVNTRKWSKRPKIFPFLPCKRLHFATHLTFAGFNNVLNPTKDLHLIIYIARESQYYSVYTAAKTICTE